MCSVGVLMGKVKRLDIDYCVRIPHPTEHALPYVTVTSEYFGPLKSVKLKDSTGDAKADYSFTIRDAVDLMRDIFKGYVKDFDDKQHDILTIILTNFYATSILYGRELLFFSRAYLDERGFDISLYRFTDEIYPYSCKFYYTKFSVKMRNKMEYLFNFFSYRFPRIGRGVKNLLGWINRRSRKPSASFSSPESAPAFTPKDCWEKSFGRLK